MTIANTQDSETSNNESNSSESSDSSIPSDIEFSESDVEPEQRVLPIRDTRGKRMKKLIGEDAMNDAEFWGHATWEEENQDEDWYTDNEAHYRDYADSDFFEKTSSEESDTDVINAAEKKITQEERIQNKRRKVYNDPLKKNPKVKASTRARPCPPAPACPEMISYTTPSTKVKGQALISQEEHLKKAALIELENSKKIATQSTESTWKKETTLKSSNSIWNGSMILYISWASDRIIQNKTNTQTINSSEEEPVTSKYMTFFVNFDHPLNSSIPPLYNKTETRECSNNELNENLKKKKNIYYDPYLNSKCESLVEFRETRLKYYKEDFTLFQSKLNQIDNLLQYLLRHIKFFDLTFQFNYEKL